MPSLSTEIHVRVSQEEIETLREMSANQQAPLSSVVRAMLRHFLIEWRAGRDVTAQLGGVTFHRK